MIKVLLADDHTVLRDGLRSLLQAAGDMEIVGTAANGQEAVEQTIEHCPDVVVMDISMPVMNGIEATQKIRASCPRTRVAILSIHHSNEYIQRAWQAGASGYLFKESAGIEVVAAIRALHAGKQYLSE
jgi:DNA-binding NarL/FixJ family response regulator